MVAEKSPEWLPSGFVEKVKYRSGRKIKEYFNVATGAKYRSKKDVLLCVTSDGGSVVTPQTKNGDDNDEGLSSNSKVEATLAMTNGFPEWLPNGWIMDEKERQSGQRAGAVYKVYTELSSGNKFYSRAAVTRYLNTLDPADTPSVQNKVAKVDDPSPDMPPQSNSMTKVESTPSKKRKGNSTKKIAEVDEPSPDTSLQHNSMTNTESSPEKRRTRNSFKKLDNVDEPSPDMSVPHKSTKPTESAPRKRRNTGSSPETSVQNKFAKQTEGVPKKRGSTSKTLDNVVEPSQDTSLQHKSKRIPVKKRNGNMPQTVTTVTTVAEDLPPGWIKEIKITESGKKTRKDPYYTDPVSGYVFRSKPDALRYLETNDISSCLCRPFKREMEDTKLIKDEIPPSAPPSGKLSHEQKLLLFGPDSDGGESSGAKSAESEPKISEQPQGNNINEADSCENVNNKDAEIDNNPKQENEPSDERIQEPSDKRIQQPSNERIQEPSNGRIPEPSDNRVQEPSNERIQEPSDKRIQEPSNERIQEPPHSNLNKKPRKRKNFGSPSRASKRLARPEPEMQPNLVMTEPALSAPANKPLECEEVDTDIPPGFSLEPSETEISDTDELDIPPGFSLPSKTEPAKEAVENPPKAEENPPKTEENRPMNEENRPINEEDRPLNEENQPINAETRPKSEENQPAEERPPIPEDEGKRQQEQPQMCYDFGDSWSDPLEFALKTLRGEISIDDNLGFPSCFDDVPYNNNNNNNQVGPDAESSKQNGGVDLLRPNSPLFDINFPSCSEFNSQSSAEAGKRDSQTKFSP